MGILKDYQDRKKKKPALETQMGSHSVEKKKKPALETQMGSHSVEKKKHVKEEVEIHPYENDSAESEHHKHMHEKVAPMKKAITPHQKEVLEDYTDDSKGINGALHHHYNGGNYQKSYKDHIDTLTDHLKEHRTKEDSAVYTGLPKSPSQHFKKGESKAEVHLPAFTSTSSSLHIARGFTESATHDNDKHTGVHPDISRHVLKLHLPKGTSAASVKKHSFIKGEHEILLNRGHDITIHANPKIHTDSNGGKFHVWDAHVAGHHPGKFEDDE